MGQMADLEEAVMHHISSLELRSPSNPDRSKSLNNLENALRIRFNHMGQMADLEEVVMHHRGSLEMRPQGTPITPYP